MMDQTETPLLPHGLPPSGVVTQSEERSNPEVGGSILVQLKECFFFYFASCKS